MKIVVEPCPDHPGRVTELGIRGWWDGMIHWWSFCTVCGRRLREFMAEGAFGA